MTDSSPSKAPFYKRAHEFLQNLGHELMAEVEDFLQGHAVQNGPITLYDANGVPAPFTVRQGPDGSFIIDGQPIPVHQSLHILSRRRAVTMLVRKNEKDENVPVLDIGGHPITVAGMFQVEGGKETLIHDPESYDLAMRRVKAADAAAHRAPKRGQVPDSCTPRIPSGHGLN